MKHTYTQHKKMKLKLINLYKKRMVSSRISIYNNFNKPTQMKQTNCI